VRYKIPFVLRLEASGKRISALQGGENVKHYLLIIGPIATMVAVSLLALGLLSIEPMIIKMRAKTK
jgi:hypothetical protein